MDEQPQCIGILGGTFDPVHNGHLSIARSFLESDEIDALWIILNPAPPHKPDARPAPYQLRFQMLEAAFNDFNATKISDIEMRLPSPTYTLQTLQYLRDTYPDFEFKLCLGKDSFVSFKSWYKWEQILSLCQLVVAERPISNQKKVDATMAQHAVFIDHKAVNISSTRIKSRIKNGASVSHLVPQGVLNIIRSHKLYQ